ncbi:MAG: fumarate hydratase [Chitinispirillaceae bacterium]
MKTIAYDSIKESVKNICIEASSRLPADVVAALRKALAEEASPTGREILLQCLENADIASSCNDPICQDTGIAIFFVEVGADVIVSGGILNDAIQEGTRQGYRDGFLRKSMVVDPLFDRINTGDNTPAITHLTTIPGELLRITLLPKGGGCENMSALAMLRPSDGADGVAVFAADTVIRSGGKPCPPIIVGIGIGGSSDHAMILAKKALLRPVGESHDDVRYAGLEKRILEMINASGVGPQGLGGCVTALAVHIEECACHMATLPVAVNLSCHAARRATIIL